MNHDQVLAKFKEIYYLGPDDDIDIWFPNGKNSVRIRFTNKREIVFTYYGKDNWVLETAGHFIGKMRKTS